MPKLIVADENEGRRNLLANTLERSGYDVTRAGTLRQAEGTALATMPEVVLLDAEWGSGDAIDASQRLMGDPEFAFKCRIVMLSRNTDQDYLKAAARAGVSEVISKPVDMNRLISQLEKHSKKQFVPPPAEVSEITGKGGAGSFDVSMVMSDGKWALPMIKGLVTPEKINIEFVNELFLIIHLGMSGTLHLLKKSNGSQNTNLSFYHSKNLPKKHNHIFFKFKKFLIIYNDPRRFGFVNLVKGKINLKSYFSKLGPDPFSEAYNFNYVKKYFYNKRKNIKNILLDQNFLSGIGNIYASEILNYSKINPLKSCNRINDEEITKIIYYTVKVLNLSIKRGGTTINNFHSIKGNQGSYQKEFRAYDRDGMGCKNKLCIGTIIKINITNRSTYMCDICQK